MVVDVCALSLEELQLCEVRGWILLLSLGKSCFGSAGW